MNTVASSTDFAQTDIPLTMQLARATMRGRSTRLFRCDPCQAASLPPGFFCLRS